MGKRRTRRPALQTPADSPGRGTIRLGLVLAVLVGVNLYFFLWRDGTSIPDIKRASVGGDATQTEPGPAPDLGDQVAGEDGDEAGEAAGRWVDGKVVGGDSMGKILRREGLTPPEADELIRALQPEMDLRKIRVGQTYRLHFDGDGVLMTFEFDVSRLVQVRASRGTDGRMVAKKIEAATETRVIEVGGTINSSLYASIKETGESVSLVAFFVDVFAYDINFYIETREGDTFRMLVEKNYHEDEFLGYGRVLAAEYHGNVGTYRAFWWKRPDAPARSKGEYYREDGRAVSKTFLKTPLKFARVSSKFNPKRMHPVLHRVKGHWGTDYAAPVGTPVWAAASGKIVHRAPKGAAGNLVVIQHDNGMKTLYMHLHRFQKGQRVGQRIQQKDVIGYVGTTGRSTGPHLHFGVKNKAGRYVDPQRLKMEPGPPVPKKYMSAFKADTEELVGRLALVAVGSEGQGEVEKAAAAPLPN